MEKTCIEVAATCSLNENKSTEPYVATGPMATMSPWSMIEAPRPVPTTSSAICLKLTNAYKSSMSAAWIATRSRHYNAA